MDGGPKKAAAENGLHNCRPYIRRIGSKANRSCVISSPNNRPANVTITTSDTWIRVNGRIFLYLASALEKDDFDSSVPVIEAPTLVFPVAVRRVGDFFCFSFLFLLLLRLSDPVCGRCAPPLKSSSSSGPQ